ncbi:MULTISPECIES: helix-turn-helix domain-containing protein [Lacticaseibacillus]|uniref:Transcriptional regulator n=1 Tax=Lacticaseibacillus casei DSM 20011 = JCM 1134 = ATCC 393 TaxID=1423732 RepID=A0AAD1ESH2_LACCA|nr:helix-turn-helix transcriptional regulator [Lacticaseibacillus casei]MBI6598816.1 helix-turn-helix transcriptional regulator [Lacticaseibacillus casei]MBO1482580.1 helix-turn-helix transcriptional regulator [Lacticaseibacillus casei]MBO2417737.1 helix-turn-helix transcriptional regulator [Lacticaseibacillus casei]MCK2082216.1 helix-turn-helix transcriptional regulator [Lacticaseibacillus casei]MED7631845.1 XRE family transcriptional regulator [Lacticaseibacillus casei]
MTLFERIQKVSREHAMSLRELNEKAGLGTNAIYRWKKTKPSADKLQAVADVLHVSVDYLLGNTDNPSPKSSVKPPDLADDNLFMYQGKPIPEEDMETLRYILDSYRKKRGKNHE